MRNSPWRRSRSRRADLKIATFNINNINKRLANLLVWLAGAKPDVVALQELKAADAEFPAEAIRKAGYHCVWRGERSWNGVALLARGAEPIVTRTELPGDPKDRQSRYIEAAVKGVLVTSIYAPNGNPQPGPKFDYKLNWMRRLNAHAGVLFAMDAPVVLAGDYNVVPTDADIYAVRSYADDALLQPEPRALYRELLSQGWVDALRAKYPSEAVYTYWSYLRNRWPRDAGLRIDHLLLNRAAAARFKDAGVDRDIRGEPEASDHAPAWIVLGEAKRAKRSGAASKASPKNERTEAERPLLVIDGDSFTHRSYHGVPKTILGRSGKPANAILGFANMLIRLWTSENPRAVLVAWDTLDAPTYRHETLASYQSGREFERALLDQLAALPDFVAACGFANAKAAGYEADDFLAAAARAEEKRGGTVLVASGDRDCFQLASEQTTILYPVRAGEMARIGPAEVRERYGVEPKQVPDFIALRGDASDRIPGAHGIGAKSAASLVRRYGTLEAMLKAGRLADQAEDLRLYKTIATMDAKAPLPTLRTRKPTWDQAAAWASTFGLNQLASRLEKLAKAR